MMPPLPGWSGFDHYTLRERIETEVREAERLRVTADKLNVRIWAELAATEDHVRHIRWLRQHEEAGGEDDRGE